MIRKLLMLIAAWPLLAQAQRTPITVEAQVLPDVVAVGPIFAEGERSPVMGEVAPLILAAVRPASLELVEGFAPSTSEVDAIKEIQTFAPSTSEVDAIKEIQTVSVLADTIKEIRTAWVDYEGYIWDGSYIGQEINQLEEGLKNKTISAEQATKRAAELQQWIDRRKVYPPRGARKIIP